MECVNKYNFDNNYMIENGFKIDDINNLYIYPGFGAYIGSVNKNIRNTEDLLNSNEGSKYKKYIASGYQLIIGPGIPDVNGITHSFGVYCYNYLEIIEIKNKRVKRLFRFLS